MNLFQEPAIFQSARDADFNQALLEQFNTAKDLPGARKTHYFDGRYENIYLEDTLVSLLSELKADARRYAEQLLGRPVTKMGCWFNAMEPGQSTTLHRHDDDDETLSGVYYIEVPPDSGNLIIHLGERLIEHPPVVGQWVFFSPQTPHEVSQNRSNQARLSIAFNFSN